MGSTRNPNMAPMLRGSTREPMSSPRLAHMTQVSGMRVTTTGQWMARWADTFLACTTDAMGNTMTAAIRPWIAPVVTLPMATSDTGRGASTRSSISLVYPNSTDLGIATDWTPWTMIDRPTPPATMLA